MFLHNCMIRSTNNCNVTWYWLLILELLLVVSMEEEKESLKLLKHVEKE